jgi:hypothetical protein
MEGRNAGRINKRRKKTDGKIRPKNLRRWYINKLIFFSGHYPFSCSYKTQCYGDWILSPSSGGTYTMNQIGSANSYLRRKVGFTELQDKSCRIQASDELTHEYGNKKGRHGDEFRGTRRRSRRPDWIWGLHGILSNGKGG